MNTIKEGWITVEFHCHTVFSRDSSNRIHALIASARARGIDKLAITDHNTIAGALVAKELAPDLIIVGEEILTQQGELLAYFLTEEIPARLSADETIARLQAQGAFIAVPHPFDHHRHGWQLPDLLRILPQVDAIEVFNARSFRPSLNDKALFFTREHGLPAIAGSDAHGLVELGFARTYLPPFDSARQLRQVVREGVIHARRLSGWAHVKANLAVVWGKLIGKRKNSQESA
jgi:predicted metal-dependent phosphoesterase TrpH